MFEKYFLSENVVFLMKSITLFDWKVALSSGKLLAAICMHRCHLTFVKGKKAAYKKFNERWVRDGEVHQRRKAAPKLYIPSTLKIHFYILVATMECDALHVLLFLDVGSWFTWFSSCWKRNSCLQSWKN